MDGIYLIEVIAKSGNVKSSKTVLENPNYKVKGLLKFTAQNLGQVELFSLLCNLKRTNS